ncbi:MAG: hypothetical protein JKY92_10035 [Magnetovibrio sp.]|nr:hypothetical protein [Magnetovibrio sp.]
MADINQIPEQLARDNIDFLLEVVGVIEAKPENWGHKITTVEEQSGDMPGQTLNG